MGVNNFQYLEVKDRVRKFQVEDGEHRVRIIDCEQKVSQNKKLMIVVYLQVENAKGGLFTYRMIDGFYYDADMSDFLDAFELSPTDDKNYSVWKGRIGKAKFKHIHHDPPKVLSNGTKIADEYILENWVMRKPPAMQGQGQAADNKADTFPEDIPF